MRGAVIIKTVYPAYFFTNPRGSSTVLPRFFIVFVTAQLCFPGNADNLRKQGVIEHFVLNGLDL